MDKVYFTREMINFYENLASNNNKEWFAENKGIYHDKIIPAAKEFVTDMGKMLETVVPNIQYKAKVDGSIFRIHKDTRINKGKPPFKTHLGIIFWHGNSRLDNPCFYFHIEPPFYHAGVGIARFTPEILSTYRTVVNDKKYIKTIADINETVEKNYFNIQGEKLKNVPKNIVPLNSLIAEYLKYKSIYINDEMPINKDFYSAELFPYIFDIFKKLTPFFNFLVDISEKSKKQQNI